MPSDHSLRFPIFVLLACAAAAPWCRASEAADAAIARLAPGFATC